MSGFISLKEEWDYIAWMLSFPEYVKFFYTVFAVEFTLKKERNKMFLLNLTKPK